MHDYKCSLGWVSSIRCPVVTDSLELIDALLDQRRDAINLWAVDRLPEQCIVLSFSIEASRKTFDIAKHEAPTKCIFCALHVFDATLKSAHYLLAGIQHSDFDKAVARQVQVLELLNSSREFAVLDEGVEVGTLTLCEDAVPFATLQEDLGVSFTKSVAEFFEVHYAHMHRDLPCGFSFTGVLRVAGVLVAARNEKLENSEGLRADIDEAIQAVARDGAIARVEANRLISFTAGNTEYVDLFQRAAGVRGGYLTEFAVGVNDEVMQALDYAINSQLNEGVRGLHIALGDGSTGLHMDLLCPDLVLQGSQEDERL